MGMKSCAWSRRGSIESTARTGIGADAPTRARPTLSPARTWFSPPRVTDVIRKIVIYTRFSSDMQRQESSEDQEREVRRGLERLGVDARDAVVLHDRAESGTKSDRAQFERLRAMVDRGEVAVVAVDDQSRLSRADNACGFITDIVYRGGRFVATGEGIDTNDEGWQLRV